jgi:hypothetical protein
MIGPNPIFLLSVDLNYLSLQPIEKRAHKNYKNAENEKGKNQLRPKVKCNHIT